jgi:nucleotide-binding universal stress UspA family protein
MTTDVGLIVVGVDEGPAARAALAFALDEGVAHGCAVEVVTAWLWTSPYEGMDHVTSIPEGQQRATEAQDRAVQHVLEGRTELPVISRTVVHAHAGPALVERAEGARMLVVGSARKGTVARAVTGSVSEHCVRHAPTTVVIVARPDRLRHRSTNEIEEVVR